LGPLNGTGWPFNRWTVAGFYFTDFWKVIKQEEQMKLSKQFFKNFGQWKVAEGCAMKDLPFAGEIKKFFDEYERKQSLEIRDTDCDSCIYKENFTF
jgi:hypothetical protein